MSVDTNKETLGFQAEVRKLLDLMIHSLYSEKEIFLRELISNASDACDRLRFEALSNDALYEGDPALKIHVDYDKKKKTITVRDNGVGMSRQEVVDGIGTIAKSGTRQFLDSLTGDQAKDARLIGEFGVGFYSSFIVAKKVVLTTRRAGSLHSEGVRWESEGTGEYTVESLERPERGTEVVLHLRKGVDDFLDGHRLRAVIRRYSDHISMPILMPKEDKDKTGEETVNAATALWARSKKEITEEEYNEFYKHVAHDFEAPLAYVHNKVEGKMEYTSLLFIPSRAPFDLWDREHRHGIKLYVRRIFIMDDAEQLMPAYLRFARGVVDSNDLPLNVSREMLQRNRAIDTIRGASVKKILGLLEDMAKKDPEKYAKFWKEFGRVFKEGIVEDPDNRDRIAKLLRIASTHDDKATQAVSLADYVGRMQANQKYIYYVIAEDFDTAKNSPHLEIFRKKGIEALVLADPVDEWVMSYLTEFDGKKLQSVAKGELDLGEIQDKDEKQKIGEASSKFKDLLGRIKTALDDKVKEVRITHRLTSSPACLVTDEYEMGAHLQRLLKATGQTVKTSKPILEINPEHPIVVRLNEEKDEKRVADWSRILFDQALLSEGGQLDDPAGFVHRLNEMFLVISGAQVKS
ncbi:MAG: molecular chaperone HtpG [Gammaproteobacteria bacterium]|nr:molecular chaperone HtpG [Gammaproteobacteria bacterium]MCI0590866.1 molecular chaperone HtpG [Gammaproteobacteria bacterium]